MSERRKKLNRNKDDIFGIPGTYECRVCGTPLSDGRKQYCSPKCRKVTYAVYRMFRWKAVRQKVLERDNNTCQMCGWSPEDEENPGHHQHKIHVDHIEAISKGGSPLDSRNLMTVCKECHIEKGIEEGDFSSSSSSSKISGYSRGSKGYDKEQMPGVPLWSYLPLRSEQSMVTGNLIEWMDDYDRAFKCPNCSSYMELETALSERGECGNCGVEIQIQAVALQESE